MPITAIKVKIDLKLSFVFMIFNIYWFVTNRNMDKSFLFNLLFFLLNTILLNIIYITHL